MTGYMTMNEISVLAADLYLILCFLPKKRRSRAAMTAFRPGFADFRDSFFTGLPDFMEYVFAGALYLGENLYLLSRFSESLVAGVTVFEAIDNIPETICVGFSFLVTVSLGTSVGRRLGAFSHAEVREAEEELAHSAKRLTRGAILGGLTIATLLVLLARPVVGLFLPGGDPATVSSAVLLTVSCAVGFVFYLLNSELVCYYKIIGAYIPAHIFFFADALLLPLGFKILLGEWFGVTGFCFGAAAGQFAALLLNLGIVWIADRRFPRRLADFRMERYLQKLIERHKEAEA